MDMCRLPHVLSSFQRAQYIILPSLVDDINAFVVGYVIVAPVEAIYNVYWANLTILRL